jgi:L-ornithine N5-monooxygenase
LQPKIFDVLGIGFGPANIALAVALQESGFRGEALFLERRPSAQWHPDMMLGGCDIQNHPCRDLVTPRNPRSRYTFINFLHENELLFEHLNLGLEFPLRKEYAAYIGWVASFFRERVKYGTEVVGLELEESEQPVYRITSAEGEAFRGRAVVLAPGRTPYVPAQFAGLVGARVFHLTDYLSRLNALERSQQLSHVAVVGGSQSAIEIVLHLGERHPQLRISNVMRGYGYRLKDTSPFSERVYFPEFVDYYYRCSDVAKARLNRHLHLTNYSCADADVIRELNVRMYDQRLSGRDRIRMLANREILSCEAGRDGVVLRLQEVNTAERTTLEDVDAVVLATGFRDLGRKENQERYPALLAGIAERLAFGPEGALAIRRDYRLSACSPRAALPPLYLNGLCESSHGYGDSGSFSLLSLRSRDIVQSLAQALNPLREPVLT